MFLARRAMRLGFPDATALRLFEMRAAR